MVKDQLIQNLVEIALKVKQIYPGIEKKIENFENFIIEGIEGGDIKKLKENIIAALDIIESAEKQAILIGKKEHLDAIVQVASAEIQEIDALKVDLNKAENHATKNLIDHIEYLKRDLEDHINREAKEAEKAAA